VASANATLGRVCFRRSRSLVGRLARCPYAVSSPMDLAFFRWLVMSGSGAKTGSARVTTTRQTYMIPDPIQLAAGGRSEVAPFCAMLLTATATAWPHVRPTRQFLPPATAGFV